MGKLGEETAAIQRLLSECAEKSVAIGTQYPVFPPGVFQCWKSNVTAIHDFWMIDKASTDFMPCCGMTNYYQAAGITINTIAKP